MRTVPDIPVRECQYIGPEQDPRTGPIHYCGSTHMWPGRSYCVDHVWKVYAKGTGINNKRQIKAIEKEMAEIKEMEGMEDA